ncbi:hypothetical protein PWT90_08593 [Aphanocladium album]|nr:hypothetical protein PWT90_08593 [Aphanocladium album]
MRLAVLVHLVHLAAANTAARQAESEYLADLAPTQLARLAALRAEHASTLTPEQAAFFDRAENAVAAVDAAEGRLLSELCPWVLPILTCMKLVKRTDDDGDVVECGTPERSQPLLLASRGRDDEDEDEEDEREKKERQKDCTCYHVPIMCDCVFALKDCKRKWHLALNTLLFAVPLVHLLLAPHTKVEESFNLQAAHDILIYGTPVGEGSGAQLAATYDHFTFPGAVPRTFVGAVLLAGVSQPLIAAVGFGAAQLVVRAALGGFNAACLLVFRRSVDAAFGQATGRWWLALTVSQFHLMFYLSRTLPNMFSFGLTTLASALLLPKASPALAYGRQKQALLLLVVSAAVFRSETAILLGCTSLQLLLRGRASLVRLIPLLAGLSLGALLLTVPIDSYFWQRIPLWPELAGFYYNAVLGSSSAWGTSPWHYYFTSALPRLLLNPLALPLAAFALTRPATRGPAADLVLPHLLFVAVYSAQPHKEARFIFYVVPALTAAAALGASYVFARRTKTRLLGLVALALLPLTILVSLAGGGAMLLLSSLNYPGGDAVAQLFRLTAGMPPPAPAAVAVHADVLTCMTGMTLFGQNPHGLPLAVADVSSAVLQLPEGVAPPLVLFDKTEDETAMAAADFWTRFDYVLAEDPSKVTAGHWRTVGVVLGYDGIEVLRPGAVAAGDDDVEKNAQVASLQPPVLGRGLTVRKMRNFVRSLTRGWYVGPRMSPRIHIMQQVKSPLSPSKKTTA